MSRLPWVFVVLGLGAATPVAADDTAPAPETAVSLREQGEALAKQGRLTDAIDAFKHADRVEAHAIHPCLIALAYIRRELWPQAEIFLASCHDRASDADPLPDWVPLADQQLGERLATANVAPVSIRVVPDGLARDTQLSVSSFAPDERFAPRAIHLPMGRHLITAVAPGHDVVEQAIEITGKAPRELVIDLEPPRRVVPRPPPRSPPPPPSRMPWVITAIGGAIVATGGAYHLFAFTPTRDKLLDATDSTPDPALYDRYSRQFDTRRSITVALYGAGAAVLITGIVLHFTRSADRDTGPRITGQLGNDGAIVGVAWWR